MKDLNIVSVFFSVAGILSLLYIVLDTGQPFIVVLYSAFLLFSFFAYNKKERIYFLLSLNAALFFLIFLVRSYVEVTGLPFIPGGDAHDYYVTVSKMCEGDFSTYFGRYKLFLFVVWQFYELTGIFTHSTHYIYFIFFNLFICSNVSPLLYKITEGRFDNRIIVSACFLTSLFPPFIQVATGTWREAFVYAPFMYSVYLSVKTKKTTDIFLFIAVFLLMVNIRAEIGIASVLFFLAYNYFFTGRESIKVPGTGKGLYFIFFMALLFASYQMDLFEYFKYKDSTSLDYQFNAYNEMANEHSDENSIARLLRNSGLPGRACLFFYTLFVPVPPPIVAAGSDNFHSVFISAGAFIWYLVFPVSIAGIIKGFKDINLEKFSKSYFLTFVIGIGIITLTSVGSLRHKLYLYPVMFVYYFYFIYTQPQQKVFKLYMAVLIVYITVILLYVFIKHLL